MPQLESNGLRALSLFSGGGGLDLGFDRAGYTHVASYEILDICGRTLRKNRPNWEVFSGSAGDVENVNWRDYEGRVDVLHGGPPCQPFSIAGKQRGANDSRNMWPAFVQAVLSVGPKAFVAENVPGLLDPKFSSFVEEHIERPLSGHYELIRFVVRADEFGVPQSRKRVIFVGFKKRAAARRFRQPSPTHTVEYELLSNGASRCAGVRESLGLNDIGFDCISPTLRSGFTGPRNTTGVVNSKASMDVWNRLQVWPHGVQRNRDLASRFPAKNNHFRLSTQDCALLQGFPADWEFDGAVYQQLGQIGNSVCPPIAYVLAKAVTEGIRR